ncbi:hypothetical protein F1188_10655 [Roseospira marina]|uniref:Uncharacterized protein n=1 Tax=Roseospira marina TaxID=140057 RepID=A0A5M6IBL3_9PROT|nr:hypothetical protein [Roseospira marina]KAA5605680.1 hypothetical protein F1188_10655 [Roseospira marina]MBB4313240.1 hypothetical protein [Roseospira marina]MBB5086019.1 hypothetical protein [Roseospira marina]
MATPVSEGDSCAPIAGRIAEVGTPSDLIGVAQGGAPDGAPLRVAGPPGALDQWGPGWPGALAAAFAEGWAETMPGRPAPTIHLTVDGGVAVGTVLALLADWTAPAGWQLDLVLDPTVPPSAVAALAARAEAAHGNHVTVRVIPDPPA